MKRFPVSVLFMVPALIMSGCNQPQTPADSNPMPAAASSPVMPEYSAEAFYQTTSYSMVGSDAHAFSSDGSSLLVSSDQSGVFNAYAMPVGGGDAVPLTDSSDNAIFAVSWFPADGRILYTYDGGGDELNHIVVREQDGSSRDLTPGDAVKADFLGWDSDGSSFYILTTERDGANFDVYRYSATDYSRERVFENPGFQASDISSNARWLVLDKPRTSADSDIYIVDLHSELPEPVLLTPHEGNIEYSSYGVTPDNRTLLYGTDEFGEFREAWTHDLETGRKNRLIAAKWDVSFVSYSPSGRYRVVGINADARTDVTIRDTASNKVLALPALPPGDIGSIRFSPDEKLLAMVIDADNAPSNIHVVDLDRGTARQLTNALSSNIDPAHLVTSKVVRYKSFDGLLIPAMLYKPHGADQANKVPGLVLVHGGPGGQTRTGYSAMVQHLVNHGYAVLGANNRGSSGYGKTYYHLDDKRHGEADLQDIVYGGKYLASLDYVDAERIGVIGGSYGGYMVAAALAFEPDAFDVGIDIFGVTNWVRTLESIPPWWEAFKESLYDEMGDPATDAERHRRISPLFHAGNIVKPLLVIQGANDPRVLQVESDELVAAVQANEVPVEYIVFPDEGHGFRKKQNRIDASNAYVKFLDTYLKGEIPGE